MHRLMTNLPALLILLLSMLPLLGCSRPAQWAEAADPAAPAPIAANGMQLGLAEQFTGLDRPVFLTHAGDGSGRIFIVQQRGQIRVVQNGQLLPVPLLNIAATRVSCVANVAC